MKTQILARQLTFCALLVMTHAVLGQGTIRFDNNIPGVVVTHIYEHEWKWYAWHGNGPQDFPPGTFDWKLRPLEGPGYSAQLFAAPGPKSENTWSSLQPASPITTFRTGAEAGFLQPVIATLAGVPADAPIATLQLRVWDNRGGLVPTYLQAVFAGPDGNIIVGESEMFEVRNIGGVINPPPALVGLRSFNLSFAVPIAPEPSVMSLLGAGGLVALWRSRLSARARRREVAPRWRGRILGGTPRPAKGIVFTLTSPAWSSEDPVRSQTRVQPWVGPQRIAFEHRIILDGMGCDDYEIRNENT
jgi:hypothetical protein